MSKIEEYRALLDTYKNEQDLQEFLENNTEFVPREFVQNHGIHFQLVFRKLKLADNYTTDFFYLSKSSDDWNCVFIELEKPRSQFFKSGTNYFHPDFLNGLHQIDKWRAWLNNKDNFNFLTNRTLSFFRQPLHSNACEMKFVLVTGRRGEYENNDHRRSLVKAKEREDFKIITFDSLVEGYGQHSPLYLGVKKNEFIEIHSEELLGNSIFEWLTPEQVRVKTKLKETLIKENEDFILAANAGSDLHNKLIATLLEPKLENWKKINTL